MSDIAKLPLTTPDIKTEQIEKLRQLFPEVFTEGDKIDMDKLRATLGDNVDDGPERFGLTWPGKRDCFRLIQEPSTGTLLPVEEESVNWDTTQNLFIEADNLEALKLLQKAYYGKVKMIYIDPPYNTGKDFIYPDRYAENLQTYLAYTGQASDDGYRFSTNPDTDGRFHSRWLNMMYPRLFLARNLLRDDGVIFVSIDDAELANLNLLLKEILGEENYRGTIIRSTGTRMGSGNKEISSEVDYVLIFSKSEQFSFMPLPMDEDDLRIYNEEDEKGKYLIRSLRRTGGENRREDRPSMFYPVVSPDGTKVYPIAPEGWESRWICSKDSYHQLLENNMIVWKKVEKDGSEVWQVYQKHYLGNAEKYASNNWNDVDGNKKATREVNSLFDGMKYFDHPKPVDFINKIIAISSESKNDIIMDFFAGSSSTAHAILHQNKTEGGNRKFILVQLPEPTDETSEAAKAGYRTIADIGKERIRRVIGRIEAEAKDLEQKISATQAMLDALAKEEEALKADQPKELFGEAKPSKELTKILEKQEKAQEELEQAQEQLENIRQCDLGFRVFRLAESNFKVWDGDLEKEDLGKQLEMALDYIRPERSEQDMLFELLIKSGFPLTTPVERLTLAGKTVWSVAEGSMLVCLERPLTQEVIRAMAAKEPPRVVVLDAGFQDNDPLKTNAVQIMRSHGVEDFRTV